MILFTREVGWAFLGSSACPIFSLLMSESGLGALSCGVIASARSPGASVPGVARSGQSNGVTVRPFFIQPYNTERDRMNVREVEV